MAAEPLISVVIPSYNPQPEDLARLYQSLLDQTLDNFEVIIVDDASNNADYTRLTDARFRVLHQPQNAGPAAARNRGATEAASDFIFFTDTDCDLAPDTLRHAHARLEHEKIIVGNTVTRVKTWFGKAVALLGFPGGGILDFDRVWRVDADGYTNSFSSCNLAFHRGAFNALGRFNETFPVPGGEDTVLARRAVESGLKIRYAPEMIVYHVEKPDLRGFLRWQLVRGRGNYHIRQHVSTVGNYLRLRVWTFRNSLVQAGALAPVVLVLIVLSVIYQSMGYQKEKKSNNQDAKSTKKDRI